MKKVFLTLLMFFTISIIFAQSAEITPVVEVTVWSLFKTILLPAIIAQFIVLFADAKKYYFSPDWNWTIFLTSKIKPFLLTTVGGSILLVILFYVPASKVFIEILTGSPITVITSAALFGAASAIIDGFLFKKNK